MYQLIFMAIIWNTFVVYENLVPNVKKQLIIIGHRFVDIIDITVHDRFWNVGQANCILKYFENMMIDRVNLNKMLDQLDLFQRKGRRGRDRMIVGFITTYAISAYRH